MDILIICKDKKAASECEKHLLKVSDAIESIETVVKPKEAVNWLKSNENPDLIFLWLHDNPKEAFDIIDKSKTEAACVVIAPNDKNAVESFNYNTLDYLVEPLNAIKVKHAIDKYNRYFKEQSEVGYLKNLQSLMLTMSRKDKEYKKRFMVKIGNTIKSVSVENIAYFFAHERIIYLVTFKGKKLPIDNTLDEVEEVLNPDEFFRANRQYIVNINSIAEIHPYFKGRVKIQLEPEQEGDVVISSEKSRSFKEWLDE